MAKNTVVNIYTPDKDIGSTIIISPIEETNNYSYVLTGNDEEGDFESSGTIYNYEGTYLGLIGKVINGGSVLRKD